MQIIHEVIVKRNSSESEDAAIILRKHYHNQIHIQMIDNMLLSLKLTNTFKKST